jgi:hypothetical protein
MGRSAGLICPCRDEPDEVRGRQLVGKSFGNRACSAPGEPIRANLGLAGPERNGVDAVAHH